MSYNQSVLYLYCLIRFPLAATEVPRTQNPLFKRRLTLTSTALPPRTTTLALGLETTTTLYAQEEDDDQVAKSSIHTSRFNQIPEQVHPRVSYELPVTASSSSGSSSAVTTSTPASTPFVASSTRK